MASINGSVWDTEYMTDRVDVEQETPGRRPSGQSKPVRTVVRTSVPCRIQYGAADPNLSEISDLNTDKVAVAFAEDLGLRKGDNLIPVSPSSGNPLQVNSARWDTALNFYGVVCDQS